MVLNHLSTSIKVVKTVGKITEAFSTLGHMALSRVLSQYIVKEAHQEGTLNGEGGQV